MSRTNVNCFKYTKGYFLESYRDNFGRDPKQWTIESLHDLWVRAKKRSDRRNKDIWKYVKRIAETIPATDGQHIVYFRQYGGVRAYIIQWDNSYKTHTLRTVNISEFKTRDERINFYISTDLNFEMGEELYRLNKLESKLHWVVFNVFWEKLEERLKEIYKDKRPNESFPIQISDKKYIINSKEKYGSYKQFEFKCELNDDVLIIS